MTIYSDGNYLNGQLQIDLTDTLTTGCFKTWIDDELITFKASAKCDETDTFNTDKAIRIIKLKIANQYYTYKKRQINQNIKKAENILKHAYNEENHCDYKLHNIRKALSTYGLSFYDV